VRTIVEGDAMSSTQSDLPGLSVPALEALLHRALPGLLAGPLSAELVAGGRSNLTYVLSDGTSRWVLRRPPLGSVAETAHDMGREHRLLAALHPTAVPVPRPLLLADADLLDAPFYVMDFADGVVLRERPQLEALSEAEAASLTDALTDVLVRLHELDPAQVGLADLGRPDGYLARQLRRWTGQLAALEGEALPELRRLGARLSQDVPLPQRACVVHGDYRLDNVVVAAGTFEIQAVLDWEMATLGDPLADLASTVVWWDGISGLDSPVAAVPGDVPGFPSSTRIVDRYAERTGLDLTRLPWYSAFALFKVAAIFEGIHERQRLGLTVGEGFDRLGAMVGPLTSRGHAALDADGTGTA
jgi:aminoglycoside phosphotransferase (APT) family kinase protein